MDETRFDYAELELLYNAFMVPAYRTAMATLALPSQQPSRGLDIGCGPGGLFPFLDGAAAGRASLIGLDISEPHLAAARVVIERHGLQDRIELRRHDLRQPLPFPDDSLDWAWAADALWPSLFERPDVVVAEMARVVRPGGTVAVFFLATSRGLLLPGLPHLDHYLDLAAERHWFAGANASMHSETASTWLRAAKLANITVSWHTVHGRQPLDAVARCYIGGYWLPERRKLTREQLRDVGMGDDAWRLWHDVSNPASPNYVLDQPEYGYVQLAALTTGRVA